jgi:hypothetical protein
MIEMIPEKSMVPSVGVVVAAEAERGDMTAAAGTTDATTAATLRFPEENLSRIF